MNDKSIITFAPHEIASVLKGSAIDLVNYMQAAQNVTPEEIIARIERMYAVAMHLAETLKTLDKSN